MTLMMKHKQSYFLGGSFALVLFMMLGYLVKFYPADLVRIDADIQIALRADLPRHWIAFSKSLPTLGMKSISLSMFCPRFSLLCLEEMEDGSFLIGW